MRARRGTSHLSRKSAAACLAQLLYFCTEERLRGFTAEGLAASYNVPPAKAEEMLSRARQGRGV
jgi:hypothetical protein